jgi:hypothetical protein
LRKIKSILVVLFIFIFFSNSYGIEKKITWPYSRYASLEGGIKSERNKVISALPNAASEGLKNINVDCVRNDLEKYLKPYWPFPELKVIIRPNWDSLPVEERWRKPAAWTDKDKPNKPITINIYPNAFTVYPDCLHGIMLHELIHAACFTSGVDDLGEKLAYGCSHLAIPGVTSISGETGKDYKDECTKGNCEKEKKQKDRRDGSPIVPPPGGDSPDDRESVSSSISSDSWPSLSVLSNVLLLFNGYFAECESLLGKFSILTNLFEVPESPEKLKGVSNVLVIPSGGLYGMENSAIIKAALDEYVKNGGTIICFSQQHGYEFSALPTPDGKPLGSYGWREDQSCQSNSVYVDTWHPALSSTTQSLISSPVDGFFTDYPQNSIALLRRRVNAMPAMLAYPYGEGMVVVTSLFEDWGSTHWQSTAQGRAIIRDLVTWAKNVGLQIPEYNLRKNPNPEVSLNLEVKNLSDKLASKVKVLWLDPDRNLILEEDKLVSIPAGEAISIAVRHVFSSIPDQKLGIWHVDYVLFDSEGNEIQPQAEIYLGSHNFISCIL